MHDLEAFGVGLHQAVLDAVVDHLRVVAGSRRAAMDVAAIGRSEALEDGLERLDVLTLSADHRAVAVDESPDAAGDAGVNEADALVPHLLPAPLGIVEVAVATVDDPVAGGEQGGELVHRLLRRVP